MLGVPSTATDAEVRSAHRRLVREYHPDVLESKGLPEDFKEFATKKMTAINEEPEAKSKDPHMQSR